ncbi:protein of unknown function [Xenorhabdus doucetiae]|uniref:Uncharacterized protein n=1 Tax=Xenorhabdus doucetiae TaxID=351671 RepID=A0A068QXC0_9GAMM|nr:protein of unknown function [Xenorhabdus doucetiae]
MVYQGEQFARLHRNGVAAALPGHRVAAQRLQPVTGKGLAVGFVLEAAGVVVVLVVTFLQLLVLHLLAEFRRPRRVLEGVILQLHLGRAHLRAAGQAGHRRFPRGADIPRLVRQDEARRHRAGVIGKHQRVAPVAALEEVEDALLRRQPLQEGKVAFLILDAELPCRVRVAQAEYHVTDTVFFQEGGDNGGNVLLLENARILAQRGAP